MSTTRVGHNLVTKYLACLPTPIRSREKPEVLLRNRRDYIDVNFVISIKTHPGDPTRAPGGAFGCMQRASPGGEPASGRSSVPGVRHFQDAKRLPWDGALSH